MEVAKRTETKQIQRNCTSNNGVGKEKWHGSGGKMHLFIRACLFLLFLTLYLFHNQLPSLEELSVEKEIWLKDGWIHIVQTCSFAQIFKTTINLRGLHIKVH